MLRVTQNEIFFNAVFLFHLQSVLKFIPRGRGGGSGMVSSSGILFYLLYANYKISTDKVYDSTLHSTIFMIGFDS